MTNHDPDSRDEAVEQADRSRRQEDGQVSETSQGDLEVGGADATDKSTGTAPEHADQPRD